MTFYSVRLPKFELLTPSTVAQAVGLLATHSGKIAVIAGGTDLIPALRKRHRTPEFVLSLRGIAGLDTIEQRSNGGIALGPLVTLNQVKDSPPVREKYAVLSEAADRFANNQVRNLATVAGNVCTSSCCADTASPLIVLGAQLGLTSSNGQRMVPVEKFCQTVFKPTLHNDELVTEISIPEPLPNTVGAYLKYTLPGVTGYSFVGVAVTLTVDGKLCKQARITLVASSQCWLREGCLYECPFPFHATEAEAALNGKGPEKAAIEKAAAIAAETAHPLVNTDYTREMIKVFTRRALEQAWDKAKVQGLA